VPPAVHTTGGEYKITEVSIHKRLRDNALPKALLAIPTIALFYVLVNAVMLVSLVELGARPLPLVVVGAIIVLYIVAARHALKGIGGKATGYLIAAGIINLPIGIIALIVGIVARRKWKKSPQAADIAQDRTAAAPIASPDTPAN
jgi:hypothetical protein